MDEKWTVITYPEGVLSDSEMYTKEELASLLMQNSFFGLGDVRGGYH